MTNKELKQRLNEFPDNFEVYIQNPASNVERAKYNLPFYKTNLIIEQTDYNKKIYIR